MRRSDIVSERARKLPFISLYGDYTSRVRVITEVGDVKRSDEN